MNKRKPNLRVRKLKNRNEYFISENSMKAAMRRKYKDSFIDYDTDTEEVELILGDLTKDTPKAGYEDFSNSQTDELKEAQLENLKMRTRVLKEKLEARKSELFSQWNLAFFNEFSEAFSKLKNDLIALHLTDEQITLLNSRIDSALVSMEDRLSTMFNDFTNESNDDEELLDE